MDPKGNYSHASRRRGIQTESRIGTAYFPRQPASISKTSGIIREVGHSHCSSGMSKCISNKIDSSKCICG